MVFTYHIILVFKLSVVTSVLIVIILSLFIYKFNFEEIKPMFKSALGTPIAFATIPDAGMPLMVLLMCICHAASMISPIHVCLVVATEYFHISLGDLVKKSMPLVISFCFLIIIYYNILLMF